MTDEAPGPEANRPPLPSPEVRRHRAEVRERFRQSGEGRRKGPPGNLSDIIIGTVCLTTAAGIALAIAIPGLMSSQGARYSVRIEWQRRAAELDAAADQARREGKLPPESGTAAHD